jgi:acyl transferase domain-containing protein
MSLTETLDTIEGIAVVGMSGRFPGAPNVEKFWENLRDGVESVTFFTDEELKNCGVSPSAFNHPSYVKAKPVLGDMEMFDAAFFGYTPREAEIMDPQHRIFLECAWEALENAGYDSDRYPGKIGVFAGASLSAYIFNVLASLKGREQLRALQQLSIGNALGTLTTRVSYKLNLKGPSVSVQTTCSTSLAAVHLACRSLLDYQCDMTLAGGVSIIIPNNEGYHYEEGGIFSPDGHCRAFDARARGTTVGDGVGIVVLKRLSDALADGDYIHAVIRGTAMNNDGSLKVGFTAPSVEGQADVIAEAQAVAGVEAESIGYIEAHGTGTSMGDPIEIKALTRAFRLQTEKRGFCAVGSLKTNIGHLDTAAGVAGLIKTVLALKHGLLPPTLNFEQPNPQIDFDRSPFYVNTSLKEWESNGGPRRAGVSSFGFGGTNVHAIVEEAPEAAKEDAKSGRPFQLLLLSAKTAEALDAASANLSSHLKRHPEINLADAAYTLQVGRKPFEERLAVVCRDAREAAEALDADDPKRVSRATLTAQSEPPVVFMFPGQGAQYVNMAAGLYETEPVFREQLDRCCELLTPHLKSDLRKLLFVSGGASAEEEAAAQLSRTRLTQPALFAVEYALARLWMSWGVRPQALIGHSIGEYVAACLSGVFSLEGALALVAARGQLLEGLPGGAMLAAPLPESELKPLLDGRRLSIAAVNGPSLCVVSGTHDAVNNFERGLAEMGLSGRKLHTSHAFHSEMVEPVMRQFSELVGRARPQPPQLPFISNVTGTWITEAEATSVEYWARHLRQTVRFADGIAELSKEPDRILLEVGPGQTLGSLAKQQSAPAERLIISSTRHPNAQQPDAEFLLTTLGRLWLAGVSIDWSKFHEHGRRRVALPTYPFERQRYWVEPQPLEVRNHSAELRKNHDLAEWFYVPLWKQTLALNVVRDAAEPKGSWLLFADECGLGDELAETLRRGGQDVFTARAGERFECVGDFEYTINPGEAADYKALLEAVGGKGRALEKIVHLWSVARGGEDASPTSAALFHQTQGTGFYSLLFLAQAVGSVRQQLAEQVLIFVVSNGLHEVTGEERLCPEKATLLSPCKVIPQEFVNVSCRSVDVALPPAPDAKGGERLCEQLLAEFDTPSSDSVVAYRGKHRWVQTFEHVQLRPSEQAPARLRENGVYLIVGGLSNIGLTLAHYLARTVKARVVLTTRSDFPGREAWDSWPASHDAEDKVSRQIMRLRKVEAAGGQALVVQAQIIDRSEMESAVERGVEAFGPINGVIHAAGIVISGEGEAQTIQEIRRVEFEPQFQSKAESLYVLEEVLRKIEPDFCLFISSLSSVLGGLGLATYTAANLFMDAFARSYSQTTNAFCTSVNLDGWQADGRESSRQQAGLGASLDKLSMSSEEGAEVLARLFTVLGVPQVVVSTGDLQARINRWIKHISSRGKAAGGRTRTGTPNAKAKSKNYIAPRSDVERRVADIWEEVLGHEQLGINDNFFELGGDSLLATQLVTRLRDAFAVELPLRRFFESPTIAELATAVEGEKTQANSGKMTKIKPVVRETLRVSRESLEHGRAAKNS